MLSDEPIHFLHSLHHVRVVIVIPLGHIDSLLHLLQGVLQHLCELQRHVFNFLFKFTNFNLLVLYPVLLLLFSLGDGLFALLCNKCLSY